MIDDSTARFLLSTIVQSIAAIWAIFFGLFLAFRDRILELRNKIKHPKGKIHLDDYIKGFLIVINIFIFLTLVFGILAFLFFRDDGLINLTVFFFILSIGSLVIYFIQFIMRHL